MAERNQLKVADQVDLGADDPSADPTRIMGFDPRRPDAAPAARNTGPRPVEPSVEDDFGIDLEKELMGEFQADGGEADAEAEAAVLVPDEPALADFDTAISSGEAEAGHADYHQAQPASWHASAAAYAAPGTGEGGLADFDFAAEDLADETAAQNIAEAGVESVDIDIDGLAREFAQALEEEADAGEDLVVLGLGATDLTRDLMPSTVQPFEDEFDEDARDLDPGAVEAVTDGDVDDDVELELDPGELNVELAGPVAALPLDDDVADEFEAAPSEQTGGWDEPVAWQNLDHGPEDEFPVIDLAIGDLSEDPGERPEAENDGDADEDDNPEQLVSSQSSSDAESDGFDHATDRIAPDRAEGDAPDHDASETDAPDEAPGLHAADASDADAAESDLRFEDDDQFFDDGEAVRFGDQPNDMAVARGQDHLPSAAAAAGLPPAAATEFSLEDELNVLLGNIKAAGLAAAAKTAAHGRAAPSHSDPAPVPAAAEDLPDFDDADFEQALADGLDNVENPADPPAGAVPAGASAIAASHAPQSPVSWRRANPGPLADAAATAQPAARPDEIDFTGAIFDEPPDIETVEVLDRAVALADDLDIPDLDYQEAVPPAAAYDDLDAEFASLLNDMNLGEPAHPQAAAPHAGVHAEQPYAAFDHAADDATLSDAPLHRTADAGDAGLFALDADNLPGSLPLEAGFDPDGTWDEAPAVATPAVPQRPRRRGLLLAGMVGAVALAGGVGALALSFGGAWSDLPALVKADSSPVKVKPENPGGTTVPNQDNAVYETVAGAAQASQPQQEKLVTTAEEPIDVSPPLRDTAEEMAAVPEDEMTAEPQPKGEDRIAQIVQETEASDANAAVTAVAPRKVRTMIVGPDGTLVPREEPALAEELAATEVEATREAAAPAGEEVTGPMAAAVPDAPTVSGDDEADTIETGAVEANPASVATMASPGGAAATTGTEAAAAEPSSSLLVMPEIAPIAPQRPAEQPIDVVGEVKPEKVAAAAPSAAPAAGNGAAWSVQIASQPNEAAARSTYQDLAGRYGSVLSGREVSIVEAEIAGRGTFWRVRIPANGRSEAIRLCESYKDAGGNCFVSR